jgi:hypothetical protein
MAGQLGMWQPKRKDGKNWRVDYTITLDGEDHTQTRKFRVRADATDFVRNAKHTLKQNPAVTAYTFKVSKIS